MLFDLGVGIGHPTITLTATNPGNSSTLAADLNAQIVDTQKDLDKLKVYPVLSFGLAVHF